MQASQPEPDGLPVEDALALLAYLVTSADLCIHEPWHYGMFRLTDGAGRLAGALARTEAGASRPWLAELHRTIEARKELMMWDTPGFEQLLRENAKTVAAHLRKEAEARGA